MSRVVVAGVGGVLLTFYVLISISKLCHSATEPPRLVVHTGRHFTGLYQDGRYH